MTVKPPNPVLLVACGNPLAGGDAFGSLVSSALATNVPPGLEILVLASGAAGLVEHLTRRRALLVVDAALSREHPVGELLDIDFFAPQRPPLLSERSVSTHAFGIARQLDLARALGVLPRAVRLLAVTVDPPGLGLPASPAVLAQVPAAARLIRAWTIHYRDNDTPPNPGNTW